MTHDDTVLNVDEMERSARAEEKESSFDKALDLIPFSNDEDDVSYLADYEPMLQDGIEEEMHDEDGRSLMANDQYYREINAIPILSVEEEREIAKRAFEGDSYARSKLIEHSLRLVGYVVKKYLGHGVEKEDLVQEGNFGLCQAAERYDYRRGFRFSTYAVWWIRRAIVRCLAAQGHPIALPEKGHRDVGAILRAIEVYRENNADTSPTIQELADITGESPERIQDLMRAATLPLSIDTPNPKKEGSTFEEIIPDMFSDTPVQMTESIELSSVLTKAMEKVLGRKDRHMMELRYGFTDGQPHSLEDIGKEFGVSRQRVQIVDKNSRDKLIQSTYGKSIKDFAENI